MNVCLEKWLFIELEIRGENLLLDAESNLLLIHLVVGVIVDLLEHKFLLP